MKKIFVILLIVFTGIGSAFAATDTASHDVTITVSEVVLLELNDSTGISLSTTSPGAGSAGLSVTGETDSTKRLYYTSLVSSGTTRTITAEIDSAITLPGLALQLSSTAAGGTEGSGAGAVTLSTTPQTIVSNIGSCATGNTASDGANLTYTLVVTDENALQVDATGQTVTVTLTLTDAL